MKRNEGEKLCQQPPWMLYFSIPVSLHWQHKSCQASQPSSGRNGRHARKTCVCVHKIIVVLGYRHHLTQTRRALTHKNTFYFLIHAKTSGEKYERDKNKETEASFLKVREYNWFIDIIVPLLCALLWVFCLFWETTNEEELASVHTRRICSSKFLIKILLFHVSPTRDVVICSFSLSFAFARQPENVSFEFKRSADNDNSRFGFPISD